MLALVIFLLAVYGLSNAIAVLKVGELLRGKSYQEPARLGRIPFFGKMLYCPACLSFWVGMAVSCWLLSPAAQAGAYGWRAMILDGLAASAVSFIVHVVTERIYQGQGKPLEI